SATSPVGVNMRRVSVAMRAIDRAEDGPLDPGMVRHALASAAAQGSSSFVVFTVACATGAAALSVVFGANDVRTIALVAGSAAVGGVARRGLGRIGIGALAQVFTAAVVAGFGGVIAITLGLGATAGVAAVCPAMVLVPGPHILNGAMDLLASRVVLGMARLGYSTLLLAAIAAGLILGLGLGDQTLALSSADVHVSWYADVPAAGVAAASYPVYFSAPYRIIGWPIAAGMVAHAAHWWLITVVHASLATAAAVSCLVVGTALAPIAHRLRIPFAAIGFAAVVSLVPGMYVFRALAALVRLTSDASPALVTAAASNGAIAALVVSGMAIGLAVPNHIRNSIVAARERRRDVR
ncbi:MAG: threonine/serine exporter family protein, partial [Mycobacteriaceae bacterium]|nr:threonine/serine exporter family protein [Mycobacteriaceae bacterium]